MDSMSMGVTLKRSRRCRRRPPRRWAALVLVHGDDALGVLHAGLVLDGAGDTQGHIDLGMHGLTGLAHLVVGGHPARVHHRTGEAPTTPPRTSASSSASAMPFSTSLLMPRPTDTTTLGAHQVHQLLGQLFSIPGPAHGCPPARGSRRASPPQPRRPWPGRRAPSSSHRDAPWTSEDGTGGQMMVAIRWPPKAGRVIFRFVFSNGVVHVDGRGGLQDSAPWLRPHRGGCSWWSVRCGAGPHSGGPGRGRYWWRR